MSDYGGDYGGNDYGGGFGGMPMGGGGYSEGYDGAYGNSGDSYGDESGYGKLPYIHYIN